MILFKKNKKNNITIDETAIADMVDEKIQSLNFTPIENTYKNDIFLAGFPKSGNTWLQNLLAGVLLDTTSRLLTPRLVNEIVPDVHAKSYYKRFFNSMIFKTHDLPKKQHRRVIHLVRDGRDAMVSYYNMGINKNVNFPYSMGEMVIEGKGVFPTKWNIHTRLWNENPFNAEILTVRYEDMHKTPISELQRISKFIKVEISNERLKDIVEYNSIYNLRQRVAKYGIDNDHTWKNKHITSFFRKGEIGNYKSEMSEDLISFFNEEAKRELSFYNYL
jgi:Sulfotransferase domain